MHRDFVVSLPRSTAVLSEAKPKDPRKRIWRLSQASKSPIELDIRPLAGTVGPPQSHIAQVVSVQEITPDKVKAEFKFQIEVPRYPIGELIFDYDPLLTPYEITLPVEPKGSEKKSAEIAKWETVVDGKQASLRVEFASPYKEPWPVCRFAAWRHARLIFPGRARPCIAQALTHGEKLKLIVHPDVAMQDWGRRQFSPPRRTCQ